jgi:hypothetical protein
MSDGQVQAYYSDAANAEVTYQTSGVGAEVSGGGLRINMIPKEGGNRVSGALFAGGTHRKWQADNTAGLRSRGVTSGDTVDHTSDYNFAIGGPIRQDRLWYFTTIRRIATNETVAQNFYRDGRQGIEDQWIYNILGRLTYQATGNTKVTGYFDRYPKFKGTRWAPSPIPTRPPGGVSGGTRPITRPRPRRRQRSRAGCSSRADTRATSSTSPASISPASRNSAGPRSGSRPPAMKS